MAKRTESSETGSARQAPVAQTNRNRAAGASRFLSAPVGKSISSLLGLLAAAVTSAGTPNPSGSMPVVFALEDIPLSASRTTLTFPATATYEMGITRVMSSGFKVTFTLDSGAVFATDPTLSVKPGNNAANPPTYVGASMDNICYRTSGGAGGSSVKFECSLPMPDSRVNAGNWLELADISIDYLAGSLCSTAASLDMRIKIVDEDDGTDVLDDTTHPSFGGNDDGLPFAGIVATAPASALYAPTDQGDTTTDMLSMPFPNLAFVDRPAVMSSDADVGASPSYARAAFRLRTSTDTAPLAQAIDGSGPYVLGPQDVVDITVTDNALQFSGAASLCIGPANITDNPFPTANTAACLSPDQTFFDANSGLPAPGTQAVNLGGGPNIIFQTDTLTVTPGVAGDSAFLGQTGIIEFVSNGVEPLGLFRSLGLTAKVTGHRGCVVTHEGNADWWPWRTNAVVLEAHNVRYPQSGDVGRFTLTNACKKPVQYVAFVGNGSSAGNAKSCGSTAAPATLACSGTIPAASPSGQPGNVTKNMYEITKQKNRTLTARFLLATSDPGCVRGSYEWEDAGSGGRQITIMQRDKSEPEEQ